MFQVSVSLWLVTALVAVVVGIWLGIAAAQSDYVWGSALFGWWVFLGGIYQLITGRFDFLSRRTWFIWLLSLAYPLAMLGYGACAYWMMRLMGQKPPGLLLVGVAAVVSTLVTIPVSWGMMSADQGSSTGSFLDYLSVLWLHGLILINVSISAVLGWLIALCMGLLP